MEKHLHRAHYDENKVVSDYWKKGYPALRLPISGGGRFKGDVLVFLPHTIKLILIRRSESSGKTIFKASEIQDVRNLAGRIAPLIYPNSVSIELVAHFPKQRKWVEKMLLDWNGEDVEFKV